MIRRAKVSIRVKSGAARFDVAVLADSAEQAVNLVRGRCLTGDVRVRSPISPKTLSVADRAARTRAIVA